ncbi:MAG: beta-mannosidase, partial [Saprospiraceae bacterium]|nr:beta-mannosidase [Saprospiraceae bacterium]
MRILLILTLVTNFLKGIAQPQLVDTNAIPAVIRLAENLENWSKDKILFGQQDALAYGVYWKKHRKNHSDVRKLVKSHPALIGWELSKLGQGPLNIDSVDFVSMQQWIINVHRQGGINSISWHMDNFVTGGNSWDTTGMVVKHILPGGDKHQEYLAKLDLFVQFLSALKYKGQTIPIIFRPFHEHTGSWFWWGKDHCSVQDYKQLWRFTIEYLR